MKNILKVAAATFLLLSGTACSDFLDEDLKKELAPDNTYTSTYGFQVGVNGLYGWARSEFNTWGGGTASLSQACPYEASRWRPISFIPVIKTVPCFHSRTCLIHLPRHSSKTTGNGRTV